MSEVSETWASPAIEARYRQFVADNWGEIDIPRLCEVMWNAGARQALASSREFSDIGPTLYRTAANVRRLLELWDSFGDGRGDAEFESLEPSGYWKTGA